MFNPGITGEGIMNLFWIFGGHKNINVFDDFFTAADASGNFSLYHARLLLYILKHLPRLRVCKIDQIVSGRLFMVHDPLQDLLLAFDTETLEIQKAVLLTGIFKL